MRYRVHKTIPISQRLWRLSDFCQMIAIQRLHNSAKTFVAVILLVPHVLDGRQHMLSSLERRLANLVVLDLSFVVKRQCYKAVDRLAR